MSDSSRSSYNVLTLAAVAVGAYVVWKYLLPVLQTAMQGAGAAANAVTNAGVDAYFALNPLPPPIQVNTAQRGVNMPGGSIVPLSSFQQIMASPDSTQLYGTYGGTRYTISGPLDANGNYTAS